MVAVAPDGQRFDLLLTGAAWFGSQGGRGEAGCWALINVSKFDIGLMK